MKNKKMRFIALAMSALMVTSSVPSVAFAAEDVIISEEAGAEVIAAAEEAGVTVEAVEEEAADTVEVNDGSLTVDEDGFIWDYANNKVTYTTSDGEDNDVHTYSNQPAKRIDVAATCEKAGYYYLQITIGGVLYDSPSQLKTDDPALNHGLTGDALAVFNGTLSARALTDDELKEKIVTAAPNTRIPATCTEAGEIVTRYTCSKCNKYFDFKTDTIKAQGHDYEVTDYEAGTNVKKDATTGKLVLGENGLPQPDVSTETMTYTVVKTCKICGVVDKSETKTVESKVGATAKIIYGDNVAVIKGYTNEETGIKDPTTKFPVATEDVTLTDCSKSGKYTVEYYNGSDAMIDSEEWTVDAHHTTTVTNIFKTENDADQCEVKTVNGVDTIVNNSCYLPVTYTAVTSCTCATCSSKKEVSGYKLNGKTVEAAEVTKVVSTESVTVEPTGRHNIDIDCKTAIDKYVTDVERDPTEISSVDAVKKLDNVKDSKWVKFSEDTSTCTEAGTVKVEYVCMLCEKVDESKTQTVTVAAKGHSLVNVRENNVDPTCQSEGSYDKVTKCEVCGYVDKTEHIGVKKLEHENTVYSIVYTSNNTTAKVIDNQGKLLSVGVGATYYNGDKTGVGVVAIPSRNKNSITFGANYEGRVTVNAVSKCAVCGKNEEALDLTDGLLEVTVTGIQAQDAKGQNGYIELSAVYTYTDDEGKTQTITAGKTSFPYYTSETAYNGRTEAEETVKNGLVLDSDGVYRYYVNGEVAKDTTDVVYYDGAQFYVVNGVLDTTVNGLTLNANDGKWYMVANGQVQTQYTGGAQYDGATFYLTAGVLDTAANGLMPYNGGTFLFAAGQLQNQVNGLWQDFDGTWYFLSKGQVQAQHTGVTIYDGAAFYVVDGKLATDYNGTVQYDGATFKVVAGQLYAA